MALTNQSGLYGTIFFNMSTWNGMDTKLMALGQISCTHFGGGDPWSSKYSTRCFYVSSFKATCFLLTGHSFIDFPMEVFAGWLLLGQGCAVFKIWGWEAEKCLTQNKVLSIILPELVQGWGLWHGENVVKNFFFGSSDCDPGYSGWPKKWLWVICQLTTVLAVRCAASPGDCSNGA